MATEYTDVDKLILGRWQDVMALFDAHEELQDRVEEVVEEVGERLGRWLDGRGYSIRTDSKTPVYIIGKDDWYHKRKDDWLVFFEIGGFAPFGFRKVKEDNPYAWLQTFNLEHLKLKDPERIEFARGLRQEIGDAAKKLGPQERGRCNWTAGKIFHRYQGAGSRRADRPARQTVRLRHHGVGGVADTGRSHRPVLAKFRAKE